MARSAKTTILQLNRSILVHHTGGANHPNLRNRWRRNPTSPTEGELIVIVSRFRQVYE